MTVVALIEMRNIVKKFGTIIALNDVSFSLEAGEVHCLLGDNGAGKSTMIKLIAGADQASEGEMRIDGQPVLLSSPSDALDRGIATVYQDLGLVPLLSVTRNFFMGREPVVDLGILKIFKLAEADRIARDQMLKIGIDIRDPRQPVGTLSGGERQSLAIARAVYFGAKVLTLDEPTSALGVAQTGIVLKYVDQLRKRGIGVIFISHNVHHAHAVGNRFTVLNRGRTVGSYTKSEIAVGQLQALMAGGRELEDLAGQLNTD